MSVNTNVRGYQPPLPVGTTTLSQLAPDPGSACSAGRVRALRCDKLSDAKKKRGLDNGTTFSAQKNSALVTAVMLEPASATGQRWLCVAVSIR